MRLHWQGCGLILHELCHLIHQVVLPDGLENAKVRVLFEEARASGRYNRTLRRDWAGLPVCHDMAYAVSDIVVVFESIFFSFCRREKLIHNST
jgi:hypothetical protein